MRVIARSTLRNFQEKHANTGIVFIRFIGTHADYDKIDATNI